MDYFEHMQERLSGRATFVPLHLDRKDTVRDFANLIGVRTPNIHAVARIGDLLNTILPQEFVLKPKFASTSIGVRLLQQLEGGGYVDLITEQTITADDLIGQAKNVSQRFLRNPNDGDFIAEELLRDSAGHFPPPDVRAYAFQGEIGMILIEHHLRTPTRTMFFDGDFQPFTDLTDRYSVAPGMELLEVIDEALVPDSRKELINVARRISTAVPSPFCRVDMYNTANGIYLGEITLEPGTFYYKNRKLMAQAEAERLGRMWSEAEERIHGSSETWS